MGIDLSFEKIIKAILACILLIVIIFIVLTFVFKVGLMEFLKSKFGITDPFSEEGKCAGKEKEGWFWCEHAKQDGTGECLQWETRGEKSSNCDPKSYKPVKYQPLENDVCKTDCRVYYCEAGQGRLDKNTCGKCQFVNEPCGGAIGNPGACCSPELVECQGQGPLGLFRGKCLPKVIIN